MLVSDYNVHYNCNVVNLSNENAFDRVVQIHVYSPVAIQCVIIGTALVWFTRSRQFVQNAPLSITPNRQQRSNGFDRRFTCNHTRYCFSDFSLPFFTVSYD